MKKLFLAMAILTPIAAAEPAMALRTSRTYDVRVEGQRLGTWRLRNRVVERSNSCQYTVQWSNVGSPLGRTALCKIDELRAGDNFDCEANRRTFFDTLIQKSSSSRCQGFDDFGQQTSIDSLIGGETSDGSIHGIFSTASVGDVQNLEVRVR